MLKSELDEIYKTETFRKIKTPILSSPNVLKAYRGIILFLFLNIYLRLIKGNFYRTF